jgi:hypothetical protein
LLYSGKKHWRQEQKEKTLVHLWKALSERKEPNNPN